jgi:HSP20 family molecular chaperone IbpA
MSGVDLDATPAEIAVTEPPRSDESKYWVSERSVGEFARTFSFPKPVDQENVKASLKNGIISIIVPKAAAPQSKRINIE